MNKFLNDWWPLLVLMPIISVAFAAVAKKFGIERDLRRGRKTKGTILFWLCVAAFSFGVVFLRIFLS